MTTTLAKRESLTRLVCSTGTIISTVCFGELQLPRLGSPYVQPAFKYPLINLLFCFLQHNCQQCRVIGILRTDPPSMSSTAIFSMLLQRTYSTVYTVETPPDSTPAILKSRVAEPPHIWAAPAPDQNFGGSRHFSSAVVLLIMSRL